MAIPSITEAEWQVMKVLWARSPLTAAQVCEALSGHTEWKLSTVKTLIGRLVEKAALSYVPRGREYLYSAAVGEADAVRSESGSFLTRCFDGAVAPMVAHFVEEHRLSESEIKELRALLDRASARSQPRSRS
jgi:BlaI family penicillinase repressor